MAAASARPWAALGGIALVAAGCNSSAAGDDGVIEISGSATVAPITAAVAGPHGIDFEMTSEGTNAGFERFCAGESAINNASVPIPGEGADVDYVAQCADNDVEFIELPIALDALSLIRNEANDFATDLTLEELALIWGPDSSVSTWAEVRSEWPDEPIGLYGRGQGSGTFDVFTQVVNDQVGAIRSDYRATDDLDELAQWIAEDDYGLGFMGVGNYLAADEDLRDSITNVAIDGVSPSLADVQEGRYEAFTRPLMLYVSVQALASDDVAEFVEYYLQEVAEVVPRVYFYALPEDAYALVQQRLADRVTGTMFDGAAVSEASVLELLESAN